MPTELRDVIDAQAEANDRTRTAEILRILKSHYRNLGVWPPPPAPPEQP
jgi:predicted glycosyltransferase